MQHEYPETTARTVFRLFGHGSEALTMSTPESLGASLHRAAGRDPAAAGGEYARDLPGPRVGKTGSTLARSLRVLILSQGRLSKAPIGLGGFEFLSVLDKVPGSVALRIVQRGVCTKV